eukprot:CCRYP_018234-RA/>CCRYP_018234-RA protein AED:0.37 eAED:0.38 QI:0/-1/0/1/-1/1/1/0/109
MEFPQGIKTKHGNSKDYVLMLLANRYSQMQAGHVWNHMVDKLREISFHQSLIDECIFYRDDMIFIVNIGDGLFFGSDDNTLSLLIKKLHYSCLNIEDQGHLADCAGENT